jgi:hypothetical protein
MLTLTLCGRHDGKSIANGRRERRNLWPPCTRSQTTAPVGSPPAERASRFLEKRPGGVGADVLSAGVWRLGLTSPCSRSGRGESKDVATKRAGPPAPRSRATGGRRSGSGGGQPARGKPDADRRAGEGSLTNASCFCGARMRSPRLATTSPGSPRLQRSWSQNRPATSVGCHRRHDASHPRPPKLLGVRSVRHRSETRRPGLGPEGRALGHQTAWRPSPCRLGSPDNQVFAAPSVGPCYRRKALAASAKQV